MLENAQLLPAKIKYGAIGKANYLSSDYAIANRSGFKQKREIMDIPFEYCALRYLLQWERKEKPLHEKFSVTPTEAGIRQALRFFQVARNFKGLQSDENAAIIVKALNSVKDIDQCNVEKRVVTLAKTLERDFEQFTLSAASKLLWLKFRWPVIIYDSRALQALRDAGYRIDKSDYFAYCKSWRKHYGDSSADIRAAVMRLNEVRPFLPAWYASDQHLLRIARRKWFRERVFDIYLWEVGGEG